MVRTLYPARTEHKRTIDIIFIVMTIILLGYVVFSLIVDAQFIKDCIFALIVIGVFYLVQKDYHIPPLIICIAFIPITLHLSGLIFGFYESLILGLGYDKIIHFTNALCGTIVIFYLLIAHSKSMPVLKAIAAMLIVLGVGAIVENIEFAGGKYLNMKGPTILSQDGFSPEVKTSIMQKLALSPQIQRDMITNDTGWDMLFNAIGTSVGLLIISILWVFDKKNLKHRVHGYEK